MRSSSTRILAFPRRGIAYTECFYDAVESLDATVLEGDWSGTWMLANIERGDVVHLHWPSFHTGAPDEHRPLRRGTAMLRFALFLALLRARGARLVWTAHNLYPHDGGRASRMHRLARWLVTRLSCVILAHGDFAASAIATEFGIPRHKICVIEHGHWIDYYPISETPAEARARLGIPHGRFVFGFVGLCKPYKNLLALIDAFATVRADATLIVAGQFQSDEYLEQVTTRLAATPGLQCVFAPEFLADAAMQTYVQAADVMVLPYADVLTSGSAMLAFSFGRPVIVPALGSLPELVVPECGVLYSPDDPSGLADAMRAARSLHFDCDEIKRHAARYSWTRSAARFLEALETH